MSNRFVLASKFVGIVLLASSPKIAFLLAATTPRVAPPIGGSVHCQLEADGKCHCGPRRGTGRNIPCRPEFTQQPQNNTPAPQQAEPAACQAADTPVKGTSTRLPYTANQTQTDNSQSGGELYRIYAVEWVKKTQPQFNSNYPERLWKIENGDITLSTLSPTLKTDPKAHLDYSFPSGKFRVLISHINKTTVNAYQVFALYNPGSTAVTVTVNTLTSTTDAEAPYKDLNGVVTPDKAITSNPGGVIANGPGDLTATRILFGKVQQDLFGTKKEYQPGTLVVKIPAEEIRVLHAPLQRPGALVTQADLTTDGPVQAAVVYTTNKNSDTKTLLTNGRLVARDENPDGNGQFDKRTREMKIANGAYFGQVGGIVQYSTFEGSITNGPVGSEVFYVFNRKRGQTYLLGANKQGNRWIRVEKNNLKIPPTPFDKLGVLREADDAAELAYSESRSLNASSPWKYYHYQDKKLQFGALKSHGNYGAEFIVNGNFQNASGKSVQVRVYIDTPEELDANVSRSLRNSIEVKQATSPDDLEKAAPKYFYADQKANQSMGTKSAQPIVDLFLGSGCRGVARIRLFYAANNTAPHILRVETADGASAGMTSTVRAVQ